MTDYQIMYMKLFNKVTDVILELQEIQRKTEEIYINSSDSTLYTSDSEQPAQGD